MCLLFTYLYLYLKSLDDIQWILCISIVVTEEWWEEDSFLCPIYSQRQIAWMTNIRWWCRNSKGNQKKTEQTAKWVMISDVAVPYYKLSIRYSHMWILWWHTDEKNPSTKSNKKRLHNGRLWLLDSFNPKSRYGSPTVVLEIEYRKNPNRLDRSKAFGWTIPTVSDYCRISTTQTGIRIHSHRPRSTIDNHAPSRIESCTVCHRRMHSFFVCSLRGAQNGSQGPRRGIHGTLRHWADQCVLQVRIWRILCFVVLLISACISNCQNESTNSRHTKERNAERNDHFVDSIFLGLSISNSETHLFSAL